MDESTGLLTVLCQHVFHCSCIQKWRGSGCPVCRYTQDDLGLGKRGQLGISHDDDTQLNACSVCHLEVNLWMCLICGNVACGRYEEAHAIAHFEQSQHSFAMDMDSQRIWDYATDGYVHAITQNKSDGKIIDHTPTQRGQNHDDDFDDYVPREKLDNISLEYNHLLKSQLDSQRMYFEEVVERAADKASKAATSADAAKTASADLASQLSAIQLSNSTLVSETIPQLERDRDRAIRKADKFELMARKLEKEWREEKAMGENLMRRIVAAEKKVEAVEKENVDLKGDNRDLLMHLDGGNKIKEISGLEDEELKEGQVYVLKAADEDEGEGSKSANGTPNGKSKGKGRKKGGGKGGGGASVGATVDAASGNKK